MILAPTSDPLNKPIPEAAAFCSKLQPSAQKEMGHGVPCLKPLPILNVLHGDPLKWMDVLALEKHFGIQSLHFPPKPIASKTISELLQSILSYAFSKSTLSMTSFLCL